MSVSAMSEGEIGTKFYEVVEYSTLAGKTNQAVRIVDREYSRAPHGLWSYLSALAQNLERCREEYNSPWQSDAELTLKLVST